MQETAKVGPYVVAAETHPADLPQMKALSADEVEGDAPAAWIGVARVLRGADLVRTRHVWGRTEQEALDLAMAAGRATARGEESHS